MKCYERVMKCYESAMCTKGLQRLRLRNLPRNPTSLLELENLPYEFTNALSGKFIFIKINFVEHISILLNI